jgi:hypothetical protein
MSADIHELRDHALDAKDFLEHRAWLRAIRDLTVLWNDDLMFAKTNEERLEIVALLKALRAVPERMRKQIENYNFQLKQHPPRHKLPEAPEDEDA